MSPEVTDQTKYARDLRAIIVMYSHLEDEAAHRFADKQMPGGNAIDELGPVGNATAWEYQIDAAETRALDPDIGGDYPEHVADATDPNELPALAVLATWEDAIRDLRNQPSDLRATVVRAADYLRRSADWLFGVDEYGDVNFLGIDELTADLKRCRARLENLLLDGRRAEWTRVKCIAPKCEVHPRLMKIWAAQVRWDRYRCYACKTEYTRSQFLQAKTQNLHDEGASRFVRPADAMKASGVPKSTMRSWMRRKDVTVAYEVPGFQKLVWWPDVRQRAIERDERLRESAARRHESA